MGDNTKPTETPREQGGRSIDDLRRQRMAEDPAASERWERTAPRRRLALGLIELRRRADKTQSDVARTAGWNQTHVARMESATGPWPTRESLVAYAQACDPETAVGFVIAHPEKQRLRIDAAIPLGDGKSDRELEALTDVWIEPASDKKGA